jgi:hypothetical protein
LVYEVHGAFYFTTVMTFLPKNIAATLFKLNDVDAQQAAIRNQNVFSRQPQYENACARLVAAD